MINIAIMILLKTVRALVLPTDPPEKGNETLFASSGSDYWPHRVSKESNRAFSRVNTNLIPSEDAET